MIEAVYSISADRVKDETSAADRNEDVFPQPRKCPALST